MAPFSQLLTLYAKMERKKKRNQPSCLSRYLKKKKKKIYESKIKAKIKMKILKKKLTMKKKKLLTNI